MASEFERGVQGTEISPLHTSLMTTGQFFEAGKKILDRGENAVEIEVDPSLVPDVFVLDDHESVQAHYPDRPVIPRISRQGM